MILFLLADLSIYYFFLNSCIFTLYRLNTFWSLTHLQKGPLLLQFNWNELFLQLQMNNQIFDSACRQCSPKADLVWWSRFSTAFTTYTKLTHPWALISATQVYFSTKYPEKKEQSQWLTQLKQKSSNSCYFHYHSHPYSESKGLKEYSLIYAWLYNLSSKQGQFSIK